MNLLLTLLLYVIEIYKFILIAAVLVSWVAPNSEHPVIQLLEKLTEPVLGRLRRIIPPFGGLDLSPMIAIIALNYLPRLLIG